MITPTQYALLVAVPTSTVIFATCVLSWRLRCFLRAMHANFDRMEKSMDEAARRNMSPTSAIL